MVEMAVITSAAEEGRSSGDFARSRKISVSSAGGTSELCQESFQYRSYDTRLRIKNDQGDVLLEDHLRLQPKHQRLAELGMFEAYAYIASFYALGLDQTLSQHLTSDLQGALGDEPHLLGSATELAHGGLAVRILSQTHRHANQALHMVWDTVRQQVQGCPAVASQM